MSAGIRAGSSNDGYVQVNGNDIITALSGGNVGIGNTSPSTKLHVNGTVTATNFAGAVTGTSSGNPTLANGSNDRVITATGSNALTGESSFTFDGSTATINGNTTDTPLILNTTSNNGSHMRFQKDGANQHFIGAGGGFALGDKEDLAFRAVDNLIFGVGTSEKVRITGAGKLQVKSSAANAVYLSLLDNDSSNEIWRVGQAADGDGYVEVLEDGGTVGCRLDASGNSFTMGNFGVGVASPDGPLHIFSGSAGSVSPDADANELIIENSGNVGLSLLTAGTGESSIYFGNPGTNGQKDGWIKYYHESHSTTANRRCLSFKSGGGSEKMRLDSAGRLLVGVTAPSTSSSVRFEVSGMSLFMNNSSSTGTVYIRNQASDAGTGHCIIFQDGSANRGAITLDNTDKVTMHGHQGILFKTGGTVGGGKEVARFNNGGGLQFKNTGCNKGIIWIHDGDGGDSCTSMANVQGSGGRGIVETKIWNIPANTTTDFAKSHWGGLALIGWSGTGHQGHEQVMFGYGGTPSSRYKRTWVGNLSVTYTMSAYTLRISHNAGNALNFWCILIGV